jgi:hypothetical protein
MAYPPKDPEANKASGKTTRETIPKPKDKRKPRKIIHFDIDVGNSALQKPLTIWNHTYIYKDSEREDILIWNCS